MPDVDKYEILVLGSGEAGKYLAWTMAKEGRRTALVERRWLGGSCPNIACLPSKNLIYSAKVTSLARRGPEFGLEMDSLRINMAGVQLRKREMAATIRLVPPSFRATSTVLGATKRPSPIIGSTPLAAKRSACI
jgi:pyruvate/2-oxoglutarate dehydrogenase complex dihydrolipoamide dehydrogenase (E3) component